MKNVHVHDIVSLCVCILFSFQIWKPKNGWKQRLTVIRFSPGSLKTLKVFYSHSYSHRMGHLILLTKLSKVFYCHWWSYMYTICPIMHILKQNIKGILISSDECILFHSFFFYLWKLCWEEARLDWERSVSLRLWKTLRLC